MHIGLAAARAEGVDVQIVADELGEIVNGRFENIRMLFHSQSLLLSCVTVSIPKTGRPVKRGGCIRLTVKKYLTNA